MIGPRAIGLIVALLLHAIAAGLLFRHWISSDSSPAPPPPALLINLSPLPPAPPTPPVRARPADARIAQRPERPAPHPEPVPIPVPKAPDAELPVALPVNAPLQLPETPIIDNSPPPSAVSQGIVTFEGLLLARIEQFRHYPEEAARRGQQGVAHLHFRMDRHGRVLELDLVGSSGVRALDNEALRTVRRAEPLPSIPPDKPDVIDVAVPVEFTLRDAMKIARGYP